jgi:endonuclease G
VYNPRKQQAAAYITANAPGEDYQVVSIAQLQQRIGINPFPALPENARDHAMSLPPPHAAGGNGRGKKRGDDMFGGLSDELIRWMERELMRMVRHLIHSL